MQLYMILNRGQNNSNKNAKYDDIGKTGKHPNLGSIQIVQNVAKAKPTSIKRGLDYSYHEHFVGLFVPFCQRLTLSFYVNVLYF